MPSNTEIRITENQNIVLASKVEDDEWVLHNGDLYHCLFSTSKAGKATQFFIHYGDHKTIISQLRPDTKVKKMYVVISATEIKP
ncbi:MAG: hypothetical protein V3V84_02445 [Candidatus Bathyarchaeia archaeon]